MQQPEKMLYVAKKEVFCSPFRGVLEGVETYFFPAGASRKVMRFPARRLAPLPVGTARKTGGAPLPPQRCAVSTRETLNKSLIY